MLSIEYGTGTLDRLNINKKLLRTLQRFPHNRTAFFQLQQTKSQTFFLRAGVPQGAMLSPTLYNIYLSDLPPASLQNTMDIIYADDATQIITSNRDPYFHNDCIIEQIQGIESFERNWKIQTNINKSKIIHMDRRRHPDTHIDGTLRPTSFDGVVLGPRISKNGYKTHVSMRQRDGTGILDNLYKLKALSSGNKIRLYKSIVVSRLTYFPVLTHCLSQTNLFLLQRIQNRHSRFIANVSLLNHRTSSSLHEEQILKPLSPPPRKSAKGVGKN